MFDRIRPLVSQKAALVLGTALTAMAFNVQNVYAQADPVVMSFSTFGDSRQDSAASKVDPTAKPVSGQDTHWLQNTKAVARILRTIQSQKPSLLFFNGDMVMGYGKAAIPPGWASAAPTVAQVNATDLSQFNMQYGFWRGMMAPVMETNIYVVPVPGNHEVQCTSANQTNVGMVNPGCASGKNATIENETNWAFNMGDLILDTTRFQNLFGQQPTNISYNPGGTTGTPDADGLTTDQTKLSYSFDFNGSHFVVINTDPVGNDQHAPTNWLAADLAAAQARGNTHFFVFGHKPAFTYDYLGNGLGSGSNQVAFAGLDNDIPARNTFWQVIEQYGATYFCGHEHTWNVSQQLVAGFMPDGVTPLPAAYQVIVGGGGSPFDPKYGAASVSPATDRDYSWATVSIHQSGSVDIKSYGFNATYGPTMQLQALTLPH